jgi:hypothetical protein
MWSTGLPCVELGRRLGRDKSSVISKAYQLKLGKHAWLSRDLTDIQAKNLEKYKNRGPRSMREQQPSREKIAKSVDAFGAVLKRG